MTENKKPLAYELADTLNDQESLALYISFTQTYQEEFLKKTLVKVMAIPESKIKRSRGALFTYLVMHHGKASNNPRN